MERNLPLLESGIVNSIVREDDTDLFNFIEKSVRLFDDQDVVDDIHRELQQVDVQSSLKWRNLLAFWENEERERMDELEDEFGSDRMASRASRGGRKAAVDKKLEEMIMSGGGFRADLEGMNLEGLVLSRANLKGANLQKCNLMDADLAGANLEGADLRRAMLTGADLKGANLKGVKYDFRTLWPLGFNIPNNAIKDPELENLGARQVFYPNIDRRRAF